MLKSLITTLILASSTVAVADTPYATNRHDDFSDRYDDFNQQRRLPRRVVLARNVRIDNVDARPVWIAIPSRVGLDRLRLKLDSGRTYVTNVVVVYDDNRRQTIPVDRWMSPRDPNLTINLERRGLQGLYVQTAGQRGYARGGGWRRNQRATIDVVGLRR